MIKTKDIEIEKSTYRQEPVIKKKNIDECRDKLRTECYENENRSKVSVTKKKNKDTLRLNIIQFAYFFLTNICLI